MKKAILIVIFITQCSVSLLAQSPPVPPGNAGAAGGPVGSSPLGAPVGSGVDVMVLFTLAYALCQWKSKKSAGVDELPASPTPGT